MASQTQTPSMTATYSPTSTTESLIQTLTVHVPSNTDILLAVILPSIAIILIINIGYYILDKRRRKVQQKQQVPTHITVISPYIVQSNPLHTIPELRI